MVLLLHVLPPGVAAVLDGGGGADTRDRGGRGSTVALQACLVPDHTQGCGHGCCVLGGHDAIWERYLHFLQGGSLMARIRIGTDAIVDCVRRTTLCLLGSAGAMAWPTTGH